MDPQTTPEPRPSWMKTLQVGSCLCFGALYLLLLSEVVRGIQSPMALLVAIAAVPIAYLAADFASGLVHWFCDRFLDPNTPVVGRLIIHPFREHHRDPLLMTRHDFFEINGNVCLALVPILALGLWQGTHLGTGVTAALLRGGFAAFVAAIFATNQFHFWAHSDKRPLIVDWLQRHRLILSPQSHSRHHQAGYDAAFCITSGWMNRVMDEHRAWEVGERILIAIGVPHTNDDKDPSPPAPS